ncbi:MAG TPA: DUF4783 domain-containing protein [Chitinophagaceae bacterium]|nr:DUF4783 domain-containing protein [Chitinophagaceae bacterium]
MKRLLLLLSVGLFSFITLNQSDNNDIVKALKSGSAEQIATYFDSFIDLKLPEKDEIKNMGKNQAGIALKAFYNDNNIKGFDLTSQREMSGTMYIAGKLKNNNKGYNITVMAKKTNDKFGIISIRIN